MTNPKEISRQAWFSHDRRFRYLLKRSFVGSTEPLRLCIWMNPSDANETKDDASIRVGMSFAKRWGDGGILVLNVMDIVCTDSTKLPDNQEEAIGELHMGYVDAVMCGYHAEGSYGKIRQEVLCGWGDKGAGRAAVRMIQRMLYFGLVPCTIGLTKSGNPGHPLRKSLDSPLLPFVRIPGERAEYITQSCP